MGRRQGPGHVPFGDYISSLGVCSARDVDNIPPRDHTYQTPVSPTFSPLTPPIRRFTRKIRHFVTGFNSPPDDDAAEGSTGHVSLGRPTEVDDDDVQNAPPQGENPRVSGAQRKKLAREEKKKRRGQNKGRRFQKVRDELDLCWKVAAGETCEFGSECV